MKVKDLLKEIERCQKEYDDFLEWDVYTEQCTEVDKEYKRKPSPPKDNDLKTLKDIEDAGYGQGWKTMIDGEGWEFFECVGFWDICPKEKIFTINVNY